MTDIKIHFVGRKDGFRSRTSAAYANSKKLKGFVFTSSGLEAAHERVQAPDPEARELAKKAKCYDCLSKKKIPTTSVLLKRQDIVVFLSKDVYDDAVKHLKFDARKCLLWQVDDIETAHLRHKRLQKTAVAKHSWEKLSHYIDQFTAQITAAAWCDVYNEHNTALGYRLPTSWVDGRKGLWRRVVHAVITTADKKYLVERRTGTRALSETRLHLSMDGTVVAGEIARQTVQRLARTKFGVSLRPEQIAFQNVKKYQNEMKNSNAYNYYTKYSNRFVYTYHVALTLENPIFLPNGSDREILLLKRRDLLRALRHPAPSMKKHLPYGRKHYAKAVKRAKIYTNHH